MTRAGRQAIALLGTLAVGLAVASPARAGCVDESILLGHRLPTVQLLPRGPVRAFAQGAGQNASAARIASTGPSIVGLWQFTFSSEGNNVAPFLIPDGAPLDSGYAQWHSDGTEIMNSSRDPATSNFCLGVWTTISGGRSYALNHFALSWDTSGSGQFCTNPPGKTSCFVGPTNIREQITVEPNGDHYSGTVTIDQYDPDGHHMFRLAGTVSATRITAD